MEIEDISAINATEYYEFSEISCEGFDKQGRSITRLNSDQHFPLFLNNVYKSSDEERKERLFMAKPTDVSLIGGYTDKDGVYVEGRISWHNDDSSTPASSKGSDNSADSTSRDSSGQTDTSTSNKDSKEK